MNEDSERSSNKKSFMHNEVEYWKDWRMLSLCIYGITNYKNIYNLIIINFVAGASGILVYLTLIGCLAAILKTIFFLAQFSKFTGLSIWTYSVLFSGLGALSLIMTMCEILVHVNDLNNMTAVLVYNLFGPNYGIWPDTTLEQIIDIFLYTTFWMSIIIFCYTIENDIIKLYGFFVPGCKILIIYLLIVTAIHFKPFLSILSTNRGKSNFFKMMRFDFEWIYDFSSWMTIFHRAIICLPFGSLALIWFFRINFKDKREIKFDQVFFDYFKLILTGKLLVIYLTFIRVLNYAPEEDIDVTAIRTPNDFERLREKINLKVGHSGIIITSPFTHYFEIMHALIVMADSFIGLLFKFASLQDTLCIEIYSMSKEILGSTKRLSIFRHFIMFSTICFIIIITSSLRGIPMYEKLLTSDCTGLFVVILSASLITFGLYNINTAYRMVFHKDLSWGFFIHLFSAYIVVISYFILYILSHALSIYNSSQYGFLPGLVSLSITFGVMIITCICYYTVNLNRLSYFIYLPGNAWNTMISEAERKLAIFERSNNRKNN